VNRVPTDRCLECGLLKKKGYTVSCGSCQQRVVVEAKRHVPSSQRQVAMVMLVFLVVMLF
jgi:hypothetical protein